MEQAGWKTCRRENQAAVSTIYQKKQAACRKLRMNFSSYHEWYSHTHTHARTHTVRAEGDKLAADKLAIQFIPQKL